MTDEPNLRDEDGLPQPVVRPRRRFSASLIWLVPIVAALVALSLVIGSYLQAGPRITISFDSAEGLDAGRTPVKYKNVVIGKVGSIDLSGDRSNVLVRVDLDKKESDFAAQGARYWIVRPRVGLGGISGLGTLLSGAYIGADVGNSKTEQTRFKGLETPPPLTHGEAGRSFVLTAPDLGSLDIGSPIYYRHIQVGRVVAYHLNKDGNGVTMQLFVDAPNDRFVTADTHFWNASGINVSLGASGLKLNTESLATVLAGGMAFGQPDDAHSNTPAAADSRFHLFDDKPSAMAPPDGPAQQIHMRYHQSVRGLAVGSPVDFLGITVGKVTSIILDFDPKTKRFPVDVVATIYPDRLGHAHKRFVQHTLGKYKGNPGALIELLVNHSLRAQLRNGNLLTGQLYVALDFFPNKAKAGKKVALKLVKTKVIDVPTVPGSFDKLQEQLAKIADSLSKVPFDSIGKNLNTSLKHADGLLQSINSDLVPQLNATLDKLSGTLDAAGNALGDDSPLQQNLGRTLHELSRAARSLRVLTDYLGRHPESLIRGKRNNDPPAPAAPQRPARQGSKP